MLDLPARKLAQLGAFFFLARFSHALATATLKYPDHSVNGVTWNLFRGTVETWTVLSFVAPSEITSFSQDLKPFFTFLTANQGVPAGSFLVQLQAGTEPFVGALPSAPHFLRESVLGKVHANELDVVMGVWLFQAPRRSRPLRTTLSSTEGGTR